MLGARVHECHLGLALLPLAAVLWDVAGWVSGAVALAFALWMLVKDWRDLFPATRDTAAWSIGPHRCPDMPPAPPLRDRVPLVAGVATAVVGLINIASALTPELPLRLRALLQLAAVGEVVAVARDRAARRARAARRRLAARPPPPPCAARRRRRCWRCWAPRTC